MLKKKAFLINVEQIFSLKNLYMLLSQSINDQEPTQLVPATTPAVTVDIGYGKTTTIMKLQIHFTLKNIKCFIVRIQNLHHVGFTKDCWIDSE